MPRKIRTTPRKLPQQDRSKVTVDAILTATARILTEEGSLNKKLQIFCCPTCWKKLDTPYDYQDFMEYHFSERLRSKQLIQQ